MYGRRCAERQQSVRTYSETLKIHGRTDVVIIINPPNSCQVVCNLGLSQAPEPSPGAKRKRKEKGRKKREGRKEKGRRKKGGRERERGRRKKNPFCVVVEEI